MLKSRLVVEATAIRAIICDKTLFDDFRVVGVVREQNYPCDALVNYIARPKIAKSDEVLYSNVDSLKVLPVPISEIYEFLYRDLINQVHGY